MLKVFTFRAYRILPAISQLFKQLQALPVSVMTTKLITDTSNCTMQ